jgi:hypothetical protein
MVGITIDTVLSQRLVREMARFEFITNSLVLTSKAIKIPIPQMEVQTSSLSVTALTITGQWLAPTKIKITTPSMLVKTRELTIRIHLR